MNDIYLMVIMYVLPILVGIIVKSLCNGAITRLSKQIEKNNDKDNKKLQEEINVLKSQNSLLFQYNVDNLNKRLELTNDKIEKEEIIKQIEMFNEMI